MYSSQLFPIVCVGRLYFCYTLYAPSRLIRFLDAIGELNFEVLTLMYATRPIYMKTIKLRAQDEDIDIGHYATVSVTVTSLSCLQQVIAINI